MVLIDISFGLGLTLATMKTPKQFLALLFLIALFCSSVPAYPGHFMIVDTAFTVPAKQAMTYKFSIGGMDGLRVDFVPLEEVAMTLKSTSWTKMRLRTFGMVTL